MGLELRALVVGSGFEPLKAKPADLQSAPIGHSGNPPNLLKILYYTKTYIRILINANRKALQRATSPQGRSSGIAPRLNSQTTFII